MITEFNDVPIPATAQAATNCFEHYALVNAPVTLCTKQDLARFWQYVLAALSASFVGTGLVRFAYAPLLPALIESGWFPAGAAVFLGAANQAGYLLGALFAWPIAHRLNSIRTLQAACVLASLSLVACSSPVSVGWFFVWRLLSGVSGGVVVVLLAPTILSYVPENRRGVASGIMFLGLGLGIVASGTILPALLRVGLAQTWIGLAVLAALVTAATWRDWPSGKADSRSPLAADKRHDRRSERAVTHIVYAAFMAISIAPLAPMMFLADFIVRTLHATSEVSSLDWILYGVGATLGPLVYGSLVDRAGIRVAIPSLCFLQGIVLASFALSSNLRLNGALSMLAGTFPSGVIPLALAWIRELFPGDLDLQNQVWTRSAVVVAISQTLTGYSYSAIVSVQPEGHRLLFAVSAAAIWASLLANIRLRRPKAERYKFSP